MNTLLAMKNTQKAKFELFARLQALGFTYDEAAALRRIEITLSRWSEMECGDEHGRCIERDETTGRPFMTYDKGSNGERGRYRIADREAGALRRLAKIIEARKAREHGTGHAAAFPWPDDVTPFHRTDPRGCSLYLLTREQLGADAIDSVYTRGLAVCA